MKCVQKILCVAGIFLAGVLTACQPRIVGPTAQLGGKTPAEMYGDPKTVALVEAIVEHDAARVAQLAHAGADVNADPNGGAVPLLWASHVRCDDCIVVLLKAGADPWLKMESSHESMIEMLIRTGAHPDQLPIFLKADLDPNHPVSNITDVSLLGIAAFQGTLRSVEQLVDAGANINFQGRSEALNVMDSALAGGNYDVVLYFLQRGYHASSLLEVAKGVQGRKVDPAHEPQRQKVIAWLRERGVKYPPFPNDDP